MELHCIGARRRKKKKSRHARLTRKKKKKKKEKKEKKKVKNEENQLSSKINENETRWRATTTLCFRRVGNKRRGVYLPTKEENMDRRVGLGQECREEKKCIRQIGRIVRKKSKELICREATEVALRYVNEPEATNLREID